MDIEKWTSDLKQCDEEIRIAENHLNDLKAKRKKMALVDVHEKPVAIEHEDGEELIKRDEADEVSEVLLKNPKEILELKEAAKKMIKRGTELLVFIAILIIMVLILKGPKLFTGEVIVVSLMLPILAVLFIINGKMDLKKVKRAENMIKRRSDQQKQTDALKETLSQINLKKQENKSSEIRNKEGCPLK